MGRTGVATSLRRASGLTSSRVVRYEKTCRTFNQRKSTNSYGFRPERSTADAVKQGFNALSRECSAQWILEGDIQGCFDHISHNWMIRHIPTDKTVLQKWLKAGYIENRILFPTQAGTPQGGIISPTLANMTLDGLEQLLSQHFPKET